MQDTRRYSRQNFGLTVLATSLGFVLVQLDVSIINVALARIGTELGTGIAGLQWIVDSYALAFASLLLSAGALGDQIGSRKGFLAGFALFVLTSAGCGLAPGTVTLIVARTIQGIGAASLVPCSLAILNQASGDSGELRVRAVSLWTAAGSVALAVGPVLGGLLVDTLGWRSIFLLNLPIGIAGIVLTLYFVEESPVSDHRLDLAGQILAILMLVGLVGATIHSESAGWLSPIVWIGFAVAVISSTAFLFVESRTAAPMLPLDFFRHPTFTAATLVGLLINFTFYGMIFIFGIYLQRIRGYSPIWSGIAFVPLPVVCFFANVMAGRATRKIDLRLLMVMGLSVDALGYLLLERIDSQTPYLWMLPGLVVTPLGVGLAVPAMTTLLLSVVPRARSGIASGVLNSVRQAGGALGVALFGLSLNVRGVAGAQAAFSVSAILLLLAAIVVAVVTVRGTQKSRSSIGRDVLPRVRGQEAGPYQR
jgi:MFS transporter, DHA2 family, methylenomycin A resistance protein